MTRVFEWMPKRVLPQLVLIGLATALPMAQAEAGNVSAMMAMEQPAVRTMPERQLSSTGLPKRKPAPMKPLAGGVSQDVFALSDDIADAEAMVKANPNDPEAYFLMAVAYSRTPYAERALTALQRSRKLARKTPEGFALFDRKIAEYESLFAKHPAPDSERLLILYRLGFGYYMRGYAAQHGYIKNSPLSSAAYYDQSEQAFRTLLSEDPSDFSAMNYLGFLLVEREPEKNLPSAMALWQESLAVSAENPGAYVLLGQAAMHQGNLRQALDYSVKALNARNAWLRAHNIDPGNIKVKL